MIYLRGIQSYELEPILQFMYPGEARCLHERMGEFIKVAKDLVVIEISNGLEMQNEEQKAQRHMSNRHGENKLKI